MSADGSFLVTILVMAGTAALIGFIRMVGIFGAATHDWTLAEAKTRTRQVAARGLEGGMEPALLIAILTAAAAAELGVADIRVKSAHELRTNASATEWPAHGRQMIFQSHRLRS